MRWATRMGIYLDPAACAWVIRRDIDPAAEFVFLSADDDVPADATPFDVPGAELSRQTRPDGDVCSFEAVLQHYELIDPTLWLIAEIVHEAVLMDKRFRAPEAHGLYEVVAGLNLVGNDRDTLAVTKPLFDGLYRKFYLGTLIGQPRYNPFW